MIQLCMYSKCQKMQTIRHSFQCCSKILSDFGLQSQPSASVSLPLHVAHNIFLPMVLLSTLPTISQVSVRALLQSSLPRQAQPPLCIFTQKHHFHALVQFQHILHAPDLHRAMQPCEVDSCLPGSSRLVCYRRPPLHTV